MIASFRSTAHGKSSSRVCADNLDTASNGNVMFPFALRETSVNRLDETSFFRANAFFIEQMPPCMARSEVRLRHLQLCARMRRAFSIFSNDEGGATPMENSRTGGVHRCLQRFDDDNRSDSCLVRRTAVAAGASWGHSCADRTTFGRRSMPASAILRVRWRHTLVMPTARRKGDSQIEDDRVGERRGGT